MARLTLIDPAQATGETKELLEAVKAKIGSIPNLTRGLANSPAALRAYVDLSNALAGGKLNGAMRERIALGTAEHNACTYCLSAHTFVAKNVLKLDQDEIDAARRFESDDERVAAGLRFARAVLEQRGQVSYEDLDQVREAGYSDGELAEIVANVRAQHADQLLQPLGRRRPRVPPRRTRSRRRLTNQRRTPWTTAASK
jgi:uncharacterized peroxidase-related enzyme